MTPPSPYVTMIDTTGGNPHLAAIAAGRPAKVAYYVTGYSWSPQEIALFPHSGHVRIDQSPALDLYAAGLADVADIETGAGSLQSLKLAVASRVARGIHLNTVYASLSTKASITSPLLPWWPTVKWWVADPSCSEAEAVAYLNANPQAMAVQWAWPSTNPRTVIPGTSLTLSVANADLSVARAAWMRDA